MHMAICPMNLGCSLKTILQLTKMVTDHPTFDHWQQQSAITEGTLQAGLNYICHFYQQAKFDTKNFSPKNVHMFYTFLISSQKSVIFVSNLKFLHLTEIFLHKQYWRDGAKNLIRLQTELPYWPGSLPQVTSGWAVPSLSVKNRSPIYWAPHGDEQLHVQGNHCQSLPWPLSGYQPYPIPSHL